MFIVFLRFSDNKGKAGEFMDGHKSWLDRGFEDGVFVFAGSIQPAAGGAILANDSSLADLEKRVKDDPFVSENVVEAEIIEITPSRTDHRLDFLH